MAQGVVPKKTGQLDHTTMNPTVSKPFINHLLTKLSDDKSLRKQ